MIVKNKESTLLKSDEIAIKLLGYISQDGKEFNCEDDPAEHIYLLCHIIGNLKARIILLLEEYGKIYGIKNLTVESINEWIDLIAKEHIRINLK